MKAISIYALTRNQNMECVQKLERQLSSRDFFLRIKEWELESMKALVKQLELHMEEVYKLRFFYSFQIPKLGKEFDLLQIKDDQIVNIELKSGIVSDEAIRRQLIQNRYCLLYTSCTAIQSHSKKGTDSVKTVGSFLAYIIEYLIGAAQTFQWRVLHRLRHWKQ